MFHVVANIDSRFSSLMEALAVYNYKRQPRESPLRKRWDESGQDT